MSLLNSASLCVTPNAYKEGTLYSVIPNTTLGDMTVVRATTATRVNSAGLIELVPYNLVTYSEQFNNAFWNQATSGSATFTVTANQTTAPNGTNTADLISITRSATSELSAIYTNVGQGLGTFKNSIYLKAKDNSNVGKTIDLWSWEGGTRGYTMITLTADWVRYEQDTTVFSVSGAELFDFGLLPISYSTSTTLAVEFYIWGAQAVQGSTAKDYFPTTDRLNVPRLDYSNGTCPSLLVEPQRTNLVLYSEQFDNAGWGKSGVTITANNTTSPDGTSNADLVTTTNATSHELLQSKIVTGVHTCSFYVKKNNSQTFYINMYSNGWTAYFNLNNGTVSSVVGSGVTANVTNAGNGWYRCSITFTSVGSEIQLGFLDTVYTGVAGNPWTIPTSVGTSGWVWGAQFEAGSYPTSYIPTTSAAVTRNADVISKTGISSLIGQTEGTILWDIYIETPTATDNENILNIDNGSFGNTFYISKSASSTIAAEMYSGGVVQASFTKSSIVKGRYKCAFAYANNNTAFFVNGVQVGSTDTSCSVPATSRFQMGLGALGASTGFINSAILFPTRLTNAELASLTTI